jgi:hypothetical protein
LPQDAEIVFGSEVSSTCLPSTSFDDLVGAGEQRRRHLEAECPRRLQVDDEFELGRLLDWQVSGQRGTRAYF